MEEPPSNPPAQSFLYETLTPIALSTATTTTTDQSPPPSDDMEGYSVFRNQISLSTIECASPDPSATIDFFSLDVGSSEVLDPVPLSEPATSWNSRAVEEPKLEGGWFKGNSKFKSPMLQLHKEIVDFCDFLSPTLEEQAARNAAVDSVFSVIKYIWPNCQVEVFGSFRTGLYLPSSDIDVVILGSGIRTPQTGLYGLSRALSQRGVAKKIQVIAKARVPIIKFVEKTSGVAFDISFDVTSGPKAAEFIKDAVSKWPPLRPLCLILKVFLQQRELNEVYSGGISSYALLVMLIAMLQSLRERQAFLPEHNLGMLLVHFFDFYGRKLNTSDVGVSCKGEGCFYSKSSKGFVIKGKPFLISVEDPETPDNDIGKNSYNYFQIRSAFAMASSTLTNVKTIMSLGENRSILGTIIRPDSVLLERKGGSNGDVTFDSLLPGAGKPVELQSGDGEMLGNWDLGDEEDPLPRGNGTVESVTPPSSGKKRKASIEKSSKSRKKARDNEKSPKKLRRRSHLRQGGTF